MADKPACKHLKQLRFRQDCNHPLIAHLWFAPPPEAECHGCPCHEPHASVVKDSLTTQPDPTPNTCRWWKDEYGNWCCSCSDTLPDFTPWTGTDPNGCFCPKCGKIITVRVHDKP